MRSSGNIATRRPVKQEEKYEETEEVQEEEDEEDETEEEEEEESWRRHAWFGELGCAEESPEDCQRLLRVSPLHNIPLDRCNNTHSLTTIAAVAAHALWPEGRSSGGHGNGSSNGATPAPAVVVDLDIYPAVLLIARKDTYHHDLVLSKVRSLTMI